MKLNESPWFFFIINPQIINAFLMEGDTLIWSDFFEVLIFVDKTDRNGLPNGAIYAAYVKFPTSFSRNLNETLEELKADSIRERYFNCFFTDNLQAFKMLS